MYRVTWIGGLSSAARYLEVPQVSVREMGRMHGTRQWRCLLHGADPKLPIGYSSMLP